MSTIIKTLSDKGFAVKEDGTNINFYDWDTEEIIATIPQNKIVNIDEQEIIKLIDNFTNKANGENLST